jgi:hypothetical protein
MKEIAHLINRFVGAEKGSAADETSFATLTRNPV